MNYKDSKKLGSAEHEGVISEQAGGGGDGDPFHWRSNHLIRLVYHL
jgi:hypothetical protein